MKTACFETLVLFLLLTFLLGCTKVASKYERTHDGDVQASSEAGPTGDAPVSSSSSHAGPEGASSSQSTGR